MDTQQHTNGGNHPGPEVRTEGDTHVGRQVQTMPAKSVMTTGAKIAALVPQTLDEVWRIAGMAVASNLTPRDLNTQERAAVAILHGMEIGLPPMASLQRIAVINGRPSVWGEAVPAIALSTNQLQEWEERIEGDGESMVAICRVVRRMGSITIVREGKFSVADAKKANLWDDREKVERRRKDGSGTFTVVNDSPWHCYPKRMLTMRARTAFRDLFSDALCGLYIAEELVTRDSDAQMRDVTPPKHQIVHNPLGGEADDEVPPKQIDPEIPVDKEDASPAQETAPAAETKKASTRRKKAETQPAKAVDEGAQKTVEQEEPAASIAVEQSNPEVASETVDRFPEPWIRQSPQNYTDYALRWIARSPDEPTARARWSSERNIRSGLSDVMPPDLLAKCQEAMARLKDVG